MKMLACDLQPSSIVEDKGFQEFLKVIDPKYIPPSRCSLMQDHLPHLYDEAKQELQQLLVSAEYVSLTTDLWTSRATMGFITVTCHFVTPDWQMKSAVLETLHVDRSHTADNIAVLLMKVAEEWNISSKVCCVVTDNANNIVAAVKKNKWNHLPCFAHTLNLIISNSLHDVPEISVIIQSVKNVVSYFNISSLAAEKLNEIQTRLNIDNHKLIQQVEMRWNSVFYMLEQIIEQEEAVCTTLCLLDKSELLISTATIEVIKEAVEILRPFEEVTREVSSDKYISASKIIPLSKALQ